MTVTYEDVAAARILKAVPISAELSLHDGSTVSMKERWSSDTIGKSRDTLESILKQINERAER